MGFFDSEGVAFSAQNDTYPGFPWHPKGICSANQIIDLGRRWQGKLAAVRLTDEVLFSEAFLIRGRLPFLGFPCRGSWQPSG